MMIRMLFIAAMTATLGLPSAAHGETWAEKLGYPADKKVLILYADCMGSAYEINQPGQKLLLSGRVHSAGVMPPCPWFEEFAKWTRAHPDQDVGICLTLNSPSENYRWRPLTAINNEDSTLVDADGYFWSSELQLALRADIKDVKKEIDWQIKKARAAGIRPSNLHPFLGSLFTREDLMQAYLEAAEKNWIPAVMVELTPDKVQKFRDEGFPLTDSMVELVQRYPLPKLDDFQFAPESESYEKKRELFYEQISTLPPGLTQITFCAAEESAGLKLIARTWQNRVWDLQLLNDEAVQDFLKKQGVIFTNWKEIMQRFETGKESRLEEVPEPTAPSGVGRLEDRLLPEDSGRPIVKRTAS